MKAPPRSIILELIQVTPKSQRIEAARCGQVNEFQTRIPCGVGHPNGIDARSQPASKNKPYSVSERKIRAGAFADRVNSLKYYINLIGAGGVT